LATVALLILASLVGAALLRREGTRTLTAFVEAVRTRRPPHQELLDGMLIAVAGVLIVLPGFVSDVLGILLLLPPSRALDRKRILRSASLPTSTHWGPGAIIDGEIVDDSPTARPTSGELRPPREP